MTNIDIHVYTCMLLWLVEACHLLEKQLNYPTLLSVTCLGWAVCRLVVFSRRLWRQAYRDMDMSSILRHPLDSTVKKMIVLVYPKVFSNGRLQGINKISVTIAFISQKCYKEQLSSYNKKRYPTSKKPIHFVWWNQSFRCV